MKNILFSTLIAFCAVAAQAEKSSSTSICDGIAAKICSDAKINKSKDNVLQILTTCDRPYIELATIPEMQLPANANENQKIAFMKKFRENFFPSRELDQTITRALEDGEATSLLSIAGSYLHFIKTTGGTGQCESYIFFNTVDGGKSQLLPNIPSKKEEGDDPICCGWDDSGHLARIGGKDVFLEFIADNKTYTIRIVPLKDGRWTNACKVETNFQDTKVLSSS